MQSLWTYFGYYSEFTLYILRFWYWSHWYKIRTSWK